MRILLLKNTHFGRFCYGADRVMEVEPSRYIEGLIRDGFVIVTKDKVTDKSPTPTPRHVEPKPNRGF